MEVVVAYAGAGFWMSSISTVVLAPEHREVASSRAAKALLASPKAAAADLTPSPLPALLVHVGVYLSMLAAPFPFMR